MSATFVLDNLADVLHGDERTRATRQLLHHVAELRVGLHQPLELGHVGLLGGISAGCGTQLARCEAGQLRPGEESSCKHFDDGEVVVKNTELAQDSLEALMAATDMDPVPTGT